MVECRQEQIKWFTFSSLNTVLLRLGFVCSLFMCSSQWKSHDFSEPLDGSSSVSMSTWFFWALSTFRTGNLRTKVLQSSWGSVSIDFSSMIDSRLRLLTSILPFCRFSFSCSAESCGEYDTLMLLKDVLEVTHQPLLWFWHCFDLCITNFVHSLYVITRIFSMFCVIITWFNSEILSNFWVGVGDMWRP